MVASLDTRHMVKVAERITLAVDTSQIHIFDMSTGNAIGFSDDR